jgi:hypothetical protein
MLASARGSYWVRIRQRRLRRRRRHLGLGGGLLASCAGEARREGRRVRALVCSLISASCRCIANSAALSALHVVLKNDTRRLDGQYTVKIDA